MRLIDADALIEILIHNKKINTEDGKESIIAVDINEVVRCVERQPIICSIK